MGYGVVACALGIGDCRSYHRELIFREVNGLLCSTSGSHPLHSKFRAIRSSRPLGVAMTARDIRGDHGKRRLLVGQIIETVSVLGEGSRAFG